MFKSTQNRGFQITFANGYTISVQWGVGNYGDHRMGKVGEEMKHHIWQSETAEVAVWNKDGEWIRPVGGDDDVKAYQTPEEVAEAIERVSKWKAV